MTHRDSRPSEARTVIGATDLSDTATAGVSWAAEVAHDLGARLHLIYALNLSGWAMDYVELGHGIRARLEAEVGLRLEEMAAKLGKPDLEITWEIGTGVASEVIVTCARRQGADLLVVGTRGLRGLDYLLLGSTAQRVVQRGPCPVLTVHPHDAGHQRPLRRILAATDFSPEAEAALRGSLQLLGGSPADTEVHLLHVFHVPYELGFEDGYLSAASGTRQWQTVTGDTRQRLEQLAAQVAERGYSVGVQAVEGNPPKAIVEAAEAMAADLVVMGTHGRTGLAHVLLGSTAERVIHKAPCPVLTVRRRQRSAG